MIPLLVGMLALDVYAQPQPGSGRRWLVTAGVSFGLACVIRPTLILVGTLAAWSVWKQARHERRLRGAVSDAVIVLALAVVPIAGFVVVYAIRGELPVLAGIAWFLTNVYTKLERVSAPEVPAGIVRFPVGCC